MTDKENPTVFYNPADHRPSLGKRIVEIPPAPKLTEADPRYEITYKPGEFRANLKQSIGCAWCGTGDGICPECKDKVITKYEQRKEQLSNGKIPDIFAKPIMPPPVNGLVFSTDQVKLGRHLKGLPAWKILDRQ